jgi:hypothetical protein
MELKFEEAVAVLDNPWAAAVARIAGKFTDDNKPLALKTELVLPDPKNEDAVKEYDKLLRQASAAGREHNPPVTVRKSVSAPFDVTVESGRGANKTASIEKHVTVTIWTIPAQSRPRGTKTPVESEPQPEQPGPDAVG